MCVCVGGWVGCVCVCVFPSIQAYTWSTDNPLFLPLLTSLLSLLPSLPPSCSLQIRAHAKRAQLMETIHMRTEPYAFDYFFEQTKQKRTAEGSKHDSSSTDTSSDTD